MSDYLGRLAQRAAPTGRQVMPRVGSLYEPMFAGPRMPTAFARDEATEPAAEPDAPQPRAVRDRLQEPQSTLNMARPEQSASAADARIVAPLVPRPVLPVMALAPSALSGTPAHEHLAGVRNADRGEAPHGLAERDATGPHVPREHHHEANPRPASVRPVVAAADRRQPVQVPRTVRIEIGRIEIRAVTPASRPSSSRPAARPRQSLEEYLQQRNRPTR